jgi:isopenicillin-N epimerase
VRFVDRELLPSLVLSAKAVARFLSVPATEIALTQGATSALNAVISSALRVHCGGVGGDGGKGGGNAEGAGEDDHAIVSLEIGYGSAKKMASIYAADLGCRALVCPVDMHRFGEDGEGLVAQVASYLDTHRARVAVVDHVTSNAGCVLPVKRLVEVMRARGVRCVIVDGAHGPLQVEAPHCGATGADVYIGSLHKWVSAPRGAAYLHCADPWLRERLRPAVMSHAQGDGFLSSFLWDGTRDYAAALAVPTAIRFLEAVGIERARDRNRALLRDAAALLCTAWCSESLVPLSNFSFMCTVALPEGIFRGTEGPLNSSHAKASTKGNQE